MDPKIAKALVVLASVRGYIVELEKDRELLEAFVSCRPKVDLVADLERFAAKARNGEKLRNPRAALEGWLRRAQDAVEEEPENPCKCPSDRVLAKLAKHHGEDVAERIRRRDVARCPEHGHREAVTA